MEPDPIREHFPQPGDDVTGDRPSSVTPDGDAVLEGATDETPEERHNRKRREARAAERDAEADE